MDPGLHSVEDLPSSPGTESATISELATPLTQSGRTSPASLDDHLTNEAPITSQRKKKKKKQKKSSAPKVVPEVGKNGSSSEARPQTLCISRNKHWKYISSYHGPWLQLPVELLDTLLTVNLNPRGPDTRPTFPLFYGLSLKKPRDRITLGFGDFTPPESPHTTYSPPLLPAPSLPLSKSGQPTPPQIDPGVFHSLRNIRCLIDEASELSVRASSGLSSAELGSLRSNSGLNATTWATANSLGINPLGSMNGSGRYVAMSAMRIHRLRALAVHKLAQAYKIDEIASSVMVMQGGSVFDDIAERVLRIDPNDADAKYVHFFHEKIPSRQLAESTPTRVLDELIAAHPQRLEYHRTRGIIHCFRDEFSQATKDFTYALKEARANRKAKLSHHESLTQSEGKSLKQGKRRKAKFSNGETPQHGSSVLENEIDGSDLEHNIKHPSLSEVDPDPIEPQLLFFRGVAYLHQAIYTIESAIIRLENVSRTPSVDGAELRLCHLEHGKYGGVEIGNPEGPLGKHDGLKLRAYAAALGEKSFKEHVDQLLRKSMRDHERFQSHFDSLEAPGGAFEGDIGVKIHRAFLLSESYHRPANMNDPNAVPGVLDGVATFTTYHPLLIESLFSVLLCQLMLADFKVILSSFVHATSIVEGLEGYPIFLPPRSMAQAEFIEVLERLAGGWRNGIQPHSLTAQRGKSRLVIPAPIESPPSTALPSPPVSRSNSYHDVVNENVAGSSSSMGIGSGRSTELISTLNTSQSCSSMEESTKDHAEALDCARILLAPIVKRQRQQAERAAAEKASTGKATKPAPINIPLHGPKVEIILAWLGAVHLPRLDGSV